MTDQYVFHISDSYTPSTMPMERLAEYMVALAKLLGETANVHFSEVFDASTALRANVDSPAQPKVHERISGLQTGDPAPDVAKAFDALDEMLRADNAFGSLTEGDRHGGVVITFPGKKKPQPAPFGPFKQEGSLDGRVYRIGGKDATKHVAIGDGNREFNLTTNEALALELRHHLFGETLRFHGTGTWYRQANGEWELRTFRIASFDVLEDTSLQDVIARLRSVPSDLRRLDDPLKQLLEDRYGAESKH